MRPERNESFDILPASQRIRRIAVVRGHRRCGLPEHRHHRRATRPEYMVILAGDHIYKMDYELMLRQHVDSGADVTVALPGWCRAPEASEFGVMAVDDADDRITAFAGKAGRSAGHARQPEVSLASMGIYVFDTAFLFEELRRDAATPGSSRDFGKDVIPYLVEHGKAVAHRFSRQLRTLGGGAARLLARCRHRSTPISRRIIDLTDVVPELDLYEKSWPIWTDSEIIAAPAKFVHDAEGRRGGAVSISSLISQRLHRLRGHHGAAQPDVHRGARWAQLLPARGGGDPALAATSAAAARLSPGGRRSRRAHSRGTWWWATTPPWTHTASAAPKAACASINQGMIDRLWHLGPGGAVAACPKPIRWSRPAASPTWSARHCPARWRRTGWRHDDLAARGYPGASWRRRRGDERRSPAIPRSWRWCTAGWPALLGTGTGAAAVSERARLLAATLGSRCWCSTRRRCSDRDGGPYGDALGPGLAGRTGAGSPRLGRAAADIAGGAIEGSGVRPAACP